MSARPIQPTLFDVAPYLKDSSWKPRPHTLAQVKSYFDGFGVSGRPIYPKRQTIADKIGIGVRTLARYLKHLCEVGWLQTVCKKAYTAVRKLLKIGDSGPAAGPANKVKSQGSTSSTREVVSTATSVVEISGPAAGFETGAAERNGTEKPQARASAPTANVPGPEKTQLWPFVKPPAIAIVNEYGRPVENPAYAIWRKAYEYCEPFIRRARNPRAYYLACMAKVGL